MISARDKRPLQVIVYSTQSEEVINKEFQLKSNVHYDAFVCKFEPGSPERLIETLDMLLQR